MDEKILIPKEEFEKLKASFDRLSEESNLRKQAEEKLKTINSELAKYNLAEEQLQFMIDSQAAILNNAAYMVISSDCEGIITTFNPAAERALGYTSDECVGKLTPVAFHDPDELAGRAGIFSAELGIPIEPGFEVFAAKARLKQTNEYEWTYIRKDGSRFPVLLSVTALCGSQGNIIGFMGIANDISGRKQAEDALRESEEKYRTLIQKIQTAVVVHGADTQIITSNLKAQELLGLPEDQLLGKTVIDSAWHFFLEDGTTAPLEKYPVSQVLATRKSLRNCVLGVHRPDKEYNVWVLVNADPVFGKVGEVAQVIVTFIDITERKQAEEELKKYRDDLEALVTERTKQLQESEFYYRRLFETMFQGVVYQDAEGKVISMNPAAEMILGRTQSELIGKSSVYAENQIFKEDGSQFPGAEHPAMVALATGREVRDVVMKLYDPRENKYRWISINAMPLFHQNETKPYQVYTLFNDITVSKAAEEALRVSEERMRLFFERQLVGMAITSPEKGWIKVNDKICEMLGYSREELTRLTWSEMTYLEDLAPDVAQFERLLHGEIDGYTLEKRFVRKDGSIVFTNLLVGCVRRPDRSVDYVLAILENITGRKQADDQIRQLNEQLAIRARSLEQANKELEAFSYSVSHDLRAPLRGIDGFSQILLDEYQDMVDDQGKDYLRRVRSATQRMAQLIDDMLNLSRVSRAEINMKQVDLSEIAISIANELHENQPEREVEFIIQKGIKVKGDSHLLRIVLVNLIRNSWKFTSKHAKARIEFGVQPQNDGPVYFIRDDGAGFDINYAQKLFGAFQRLHTVDEFQGTGIGLATVQRIINRHGGKVWAEGELEKGATFYFTIAK